ncbi:MAG: CRP-like cAMP-activated global transcriptional regulator [Candidatus Anoxychlamydiales bacterium]|nr:CRP-like cAMP-activated global transcriptional regulator [Candidatus Anoxychlamydiales bacterium]
MKEISLISVTFLLKSINLFEDLDLDILIAIADKMHQEIFDENEKIFDVNQIASRMYIIAKGSVEILDENENVISTLKESDFFGDESLFNELPRSYMARCQKDTLLLTLSKSNLLTIISECPSIGIALLQSYSKNITFRKVR